MFTVEAHLPNGVDEHGALHLYEEAPESPRPLTPEEQHKDSKAGVLSKVAGALTIAMLPAAFVLLANSLENNNFGLFTLTPAVIGFIVFGLIWISLDCYRIELEKTRMQERSLQALTADELAATGLGSHMQNLPLLAATLNAALDSSRVSDNLKALAEMAPARGSISESVHQRTVLINEIHEVLLTRGLVVRPGSPNRVSDAETQEIPVVR